MQYVKWVKNAFHGEFGISFKYKQDVVDVIGGRIGNTLVLGGIGFIIMFAGALLLGILCAWYENRLADRIDVYKRQTLLSAAQVPMRRNFILIRISMHFRIM